MSQNDHVKIDPRAVPLGSPIQTQNQNIAIDQSQLFIISGPSGAGKGTVINQLLAANPGIKVAISVTTRLPREGEIEGTHYYFTSRDSFMKDVQSNEFLEWCEVHGNLYGTLKREITRLQRDGSQVILEIDVQGAKKVRAVLDQVKTIFIAPPSLDELRLRLINRGTDSQASIQKRLTNAIEELNEKNTYDHCVVNESVNDTVDKIGLFIRKQTR